jgi:tetraacyldisaccharide 4'-kinase
MKKRIRKFLKLVFLLPISWIWEFVHHVRRIFYDYGLLKQYSFHVPVISIGNLTFGGTGKTPFTLWLAKFLFQENKKVMILMRGYKGKLEHEGGVIEAGKKINPDPYIYGDEALLYARHLENATIVVGKKRSENLSYYFPKYSPDVVLLDDGHQHIKIKRKINIIIFDALMPISEYQVAPMGYMREGFHALKDADFVAIGRSDQVTLERLIQLKDFLVPHLPPHVSIAECGHAPIGLFSGESNLKYSLSDIPKLKIVAIAGIGNPQSFYKLLEKLGARILMKETFADHHFFTLEEIKPLLEFAKSENAIVVTTEKDMVRLKKIISDDAILYLGVELKFFTGEDEIKNIIREALHDKK